MRLADAAAHCTHDSTAHGGKSKTKDEENDGRQPERNKSHDLGGFRTVRIIIDRHLLTDTVIGGAAADLGAKLNRATVGNAEGPHRRIICRL